MKTKVLAIIVSITFSFVFCFCPWFIVVSYADSYAKKVTANNVVNIDFFGGLVGYFYDLIMQGFTNSINESFSIIANGGYDNDAYYNDLLESGRMWYCELCDCCYDQSTGLAYLASPNVGDATDQTYYTIKHNDLHASNEKINYALENGSELNSASQVPVSGKTFADIVAQLQEQYGPSIATDKVSIQDNNAYVPEDTTSEILWLRLAENGEAYGYNLSNPIYVLPYYTDSLGVNYYCGLTLAFKMGFNGSTMSWWTASKNTFEDNSAYNEYSCNGSPDLSAYPYVGFGYTAAGFRLLFGTQSTSHERHIHIGNLGGTSADGLGTNISFANVILGALPDYSKRADNLPIDWGYYISDEDIVLTEYFSDIDPSKIDPNAIVTMTGGDVYNYTITNDNGDSSTINEYITNNYTYITNNNGGDGSSSGEGLEFDEDISLGNFYDWLLESTEGLRSFFSDFFSFLPIEMIYLLGAALTIVILCRVLGR